jgi:DNA-binding transcriptional LysR family regulator
MLNLSRLRLLSELSVLGTISAVADAVHLTRPAISQQLALLEQELDVVLFERSGRSVELTPIGKRLAARSVELFRLVNDIEAELAQSKHEVTGEVRVAAFGSVAVGIMPFAMRALETSHPKLSISLVEMEPTEGLKAAAAHQVDLAVVDDMTSIETHASKLEFEPLCTDHFMLVMSSSNRLAELKSIHLNDLASERWALNLSAVSYLSFLLRAFRSAGFDPRVSSNCRNTAATIEIVRTSSLITVLPNLLLGPVRRDPDFVCVPLKPILLRQIAVAAPKGAFKLPAVKAVIDALKAVELDGIK